MKKIVLFLTLFCSLSVFGQETLLERQAERTKEKIKQRAESRIEGGVDKTLDKTEEEMGKVGKGEKKKKTANQKENEEDAPGKTDTGSGVEKTNTSFGTRGKENSEFRAYSKFDFVPGEKVIAYEDFSQNTVGDFPSDWNTNSGGEVVLFENNTGQWLNLNNTGIFYPEYIRELPLNVTLEMDLYVSEDFSEMQSGLALFFPELKSRNLLFDYHFSSVPQAGLDIHPYGTSGTSSIWVFNQAEEKVLSNEMPLNSVWKTGQINRVSIWKQHSRLRVYINETKIWDIPKAFFNEVKYSLLFGTNIWEGKVYISNIRVAEGTPDTRNRLLKEGRVTSYGITFDVNSDRLKPESYGTLQEFAKLLKENPELKVLIVGHTDSDGNEASNLELSKKRAEAIKKALIEEFGISKDKLQTDGKGEAEPLAENVTLTGKAKNRRVEFVKIE